MICFVDYAVGHGLVHGLRAQNFSSTQGTITQSEVTTHTGSKGRTNYDADIRYRYEVGHKQFEGDTYRFGGMEASDPESAHATVRAHKVGAPVTVYYDAGDPSDSVLHPGIEGSSLFLLIFLTPFNVVMLAFWRFGGEWIWHWWHGTKPKLVVWSRVGNATRVRLSDATALESGVVAAGAAAFVVAFIGAFAVGFDMSIATALALWAVVLGAGIATGLWVRRKEVEGAYDFVIGDRTVELPASFDRKRRETVDRPAVSGVAVRAFERPGRRGPTTVYEIAIQRRGGSNATIAEWYDGERAEELAAWLREQLGLRQSP